MREHFDVKRYQKTWRRVNLSLLNLYRQFLSELKFNKLLLLLPGPGHAQAQKYARLKTQ